MRPHAACVRTADVVEYDATTELASYIYAYFLKKVSYSQISVYRGWDITEDCPC